MEPAGPSISATIPMNVDLIDDLETALIDIEDRPATAASPLGYMRREIRAASNGLLSIFDQAIVSGTAFATAAIIGRMTSPDELGLYYLTLTIVLIVIGIQDQVIAAPYMLFSKRYEGRAHDEYAGSVWLHHWALTGVTMVGLATTIGVFSAMGSTAIVPGLWALLGAAPLLLLREDLRRFTFADLHVRTAIAVDTTVAVVQLGGLFLLGYLGRLTLFAIFGVMGGACAVAALVWLAFDPPRVRFSAERFRGDWRHNWAFAKWALRGHLLVSTTPYFMIWLVNWAIGPVAAGVLGACTTLIGITRVIQAGVTNVLTTQSAQAFAGGGWTALRRLLLRNAAFLALTLGGSCLLFIVTGDALAVLVYGEFYRGSGPILIVLALGALLSSFSVVAGNGLWAIDRARSNFIADVCCTVGTLVAAAVLVAPLGALGAALATLVGNAAATIVRVMILLRAWGSDESETKSS
jgi:O-antigen/teichoic acid export membrane protein